VADIDACLGYLEQKAKGGPERESLQKMVFENRNFKQEYSGRRIKVNQDAKKQTTRNAETTILASISAGRMGKGNRKKRGTYIFLGKLDIYLAFFIKGCG